MLREIIPNSYELWACDSMCSIKEKIEKEYEMLISNLNNAAKASYLSLKSNFAEIIAVREEIKQMEVGMMNQSADICHSVESSCQYLPSPPPLVSTSAAPVPLMQVMISSSTSPVEQTQFEVNCDADQHHNYPGNQVVTPRNTPRVPIFCSKQCKTVRELTHEYLSHRVRIAGLTAFDSQNNRQVISQSSNNIYAVITKIVYSII
jgi:hypothetical protein